MTVTDIATSALGYRYRQIFWRRPAEIPSIDRSRGKSIQGADIDIEWEKEDSKSTCKYRGSNEHRHSYEFNKYVPDFYNGCYRIQFQCEYCGDEVFDKVNDECNENFDTSSMYP
jgi:hypothetical protein